MVYAFLLTSETRRQRLLVHSATCVEAILGHRFQALNLQARLVELASVAKRTQRRWQAMVRVSVATASYKDECS